MSEQNANCTRENYLTQVRERWSGEALRDAKLNWQEFEERRETFVAWMKLFRRNSGLCVGKKYYNPDHTLSGCVWRMQEALAKDNSCLMPCLDFEEHFQRVFIRRGLIIYLKLILKDLESSEPCDPNQLMLEEAQNAA